MHSPVSDFSRGDPDLGGFRPLPRGVIPSPIKRPDYRTSDPFGYNELGADVLRHDHGKRSRRQEAPRRTPEQIRQRLRYEYRVSMAKDRLGWVSDCRDPTACYGISYFANGLRRYSRSDSPR